MRDEGVEILLRKAIDESAENQVKMDALERDVGKKKCKRQKCCGNSCYKGVAVLLMEAVTQFEVFRVEKTIGSVEGPDCDEHSQRGRDREVNAVTLRR